MASTATDSKKISNKFKQKNRRNKQNKTVILFDEKAREDYLTGFRKRKVERRKAAQQEMLTQYKLEKKKIKEKRLAMIIASKHRHQKDADVEDQPTIIPAVYSLPEATVTITDVSDGDFVGKTGLRLGANLVKDYSETEEAAVAAAKPETKIVTTKKGKKEKLSNNVMKTLNRLASKTQPKQKKKRKKGSHGKLAKGSKKRGRH